MTEDILIVYSSRTGNTKKLAGGIAEGFTESGIKAGLMPVEEENGAERAAAAETVFVGFWADRGDADAKALSFLQKLSGKRVGLFGTLGAYPDSAHARDLAGKLKALAAEKNTCLGCFLCQGKIDPALTEQFKKFPPGHPHAMTEERAARHAEAARHPDEADIEAARRACAAMLGKGRTEILSLYLCAGKRRTEERLPPVRPGKIYRARRHNTGKVLCSGYFSNFSESSSE